MQEDYRHKAVFFMKSISLLKQGYTSEQSSCVLMVASNITRVNMDFVPLLGERGLVQGDGWGCNQNWDGLDKRLKEGKGKPMPNPTRCVRETEQGDTMGDLNFSSTKDTSEAPLAPFTAVRGNQLVILLL